MGQMDGCRDGQATTDNVAYLELNNDRNSETCTVK